MSETEATVVKSKREIIAECIEAGGATMDSLIAAADCKYESVMSNFSMLRLMGKCPVKDVEVDGVMTYRFVTSAEWEAMKAEKSANAGTKKAVAAKSPAERLIAAEKRVDKCDKAAVGAVERAEAAPDDELLGLRAQKAEIELKIAKFELDTLTALVENDKTALEEYNSLKAAPVPEDQESSDTEPEDVPVENPADGSNDDDIDFE